MNTSSAGQPEALTISRESPETPGLRTRAREDDAAKSATGEDELLAAIAAALQAQATAPPAPAAEAKASDPAERWRQSGGALTGTGAHIDAGEAASGAGSTEKGTESRLVARIDTPGMGSVCVVVDRSETGLKVWLAMDDVAVAQRAHAQRGALVRALEAVGLTVASVSVTRVRDGGITFAQVRDAHEAQLFGASEGSETAEGRPGARSRRRLNLVG